MYKDKDVKMEKLSINKFNQNTDNLATIRLC